MIRDPFAANPNSTPTPRSKNTQNHSKNQVTAARLSLLVFRHRHRDTFNHLRCWTALSQCQCSTQHATSPPLGGTRPMPVLDTTSDISAVGRHPASASARHNIRHLRHWAALGQCQCSTQCPTSAPLGRTQPVPVRDTTCNMLVAMVDNVIIRVPLQQLSNVGGLICVCND